MQNEKRALRRIDNKFGVELKAVLFSENESINAKIIDYNSLSISVQLDELGFMGIETSPVNILHIYFGKELICEVQNPHLVRTINLKKILIFNLRSRTSKNLNREERVNLSFDMQGTLTGLDPFSISQSLVFRLHNISKKGFAAISSKSNRHLTPGLKLKNFSLTFPGMKPFLVSCMITNISESGNYLKLGCRLLEMPKELEIEIERAILVNKVMPTKLTIDENLKSAIKKIKKFDGKIRIRRSTSQEEYEKILKLRFIAYKNANKVHPDQSWESMADEHDVNSIIYVAYVGPNLAATMRLVFPDVLGKLPFHASLTDKLFIDLEASKSAEISKFAIDPHLQGTEIFFEMFKNIIFEIGAKGIKFPVCLATKKLSKYYKGIGAKEISNAIPHPTIQNETLTLLLFDPDTIIDGKMSALGWFFVARPALKLLKKFQFVRTPSYGFSKYLILPIELAGIYLKRILTGSKKQTNTQNTTQYNSEDKSA